MVTCPFDMVFPHTARFNDIFAYKYIPVENTSMCTSSNMRKDNMTWYCCVNYYYDDQSSSGYTHIHSTVGTYFIPRWYVKYVPTVYMYCSLRKHHKECGPNMVIDGVVCSFTRNIWPVLFLVCYKEVDYSVEV